MFDDPTLIHTIVAGLTDFWLEAFDQTLQDGVRIDQVMFFEDMCATKAPLIGPAMIEAGVNGFHPCEVQAGLERGPLRLTSPGKTCSCMPDTSGSGR